MSSVDQYLRHGKHQGGSDDWQTPLRLYLNLNKEFGFTRDAAASSDNALCSRFWDEQTDALRQDWSSEKFVFCNPPFSQAEEFLARAHLPDCCVMIVPVRPQTTVWLRYVWSNPHLHEIRFLHRGVRFDHPDGKEAVRSPLPVCVLVYRNSPNNTGVKITVCCADTLLVLEDVSHKRKTGRPRTYTWEQLDKVIQMHDKNKSVRDISKATGLSSSIIYRIVQRLY